MAIQNEQYEMIMMETMERTEKTVSVLNGEYVTIRAGRANPQILPSFSATTIYCSGSSRMVKI